MLILWLDNCHTICKDRVLHLTKLNLYLESQFSNFPSRKHKITQRSRQVIENFTKEKKRSQSSKHKSFYYSRKIKLSERGRMALEEGEKSCFYKNPTKILKFLDIDAQINSQTELCPKEGSQLEYCHEKYINFFLNRSQKVGA